MSEETLSEETVVGDEGTKLGEFDQNVDFNAAIKKEDDTSGEDLTATKMGSMSEFERSLYEESQSEERQSVTSTGTKTAKKSSSQDVSFEQEMSNPMVDYMEGDLVDGVVRSVEKGGVLVDISYKSDGFISNSDFSNDPSVNPSDLLKEGDSIKVYIEKLESREGYTILSRKKAEYEEAWNTIIESVKTKQTVDVHVSNKVQGGLVASYKGIKGFIPASQVLKGSDDELDSFINQTLTVVVLQADRRRRKVIFSHKLAKSKEQQSSLNQAIESLDVGEVREGKVTSVKDFGVFVEIEPSVEGLVHISELSWSRVSHPSDLVAVGDTVKVFVLGVDKDNMKISLGMKQLEKDPWVNVTEKYKLGQVVKGKVTRTVAFGAFFQIENDLEGLIHISELSEKHVEKVEDVVSIGDELEVVIIKLVPDEQKIGLSVKALKETQEQSEFQSEETAEEAEQVTNEDTQEDVAEAPEATEQAQVTEKESIQAETL